MSNTPNNNTTDFEKNFMFVIDVYSMYKYDVKSKKLAKIFDLDEIKSKDDIIANMRDAMI